MALLGPTGEPVTSHLQAVPQPSPDEPPAPVQVTTAFLVYQRPNGQWVASDDLATPVVPVRRPIPDDIISGTTNVCEQIVARKAAEMSAALTVQTQMQVAQQLQNATPTAQEAAVLADIGSAPAAFRRTR